MIVRSFVVEPEMVNIPPPVGIGFNGDSGVSSYVNRLPGGDPVNVNTCCIGSVINPEVEGASAVVMHNPIRTAVSTETKRIVLTIRLLFSGVFLFDILIVFMLPKLHLRQLIQIGISEWSYA